MFPPILIILIEMKPLLSIGGGGMKGYVECAVLAEIERRSGKSICELFGLIAGTSVGGIIALSLACGNSASDTLTFFTADGPNIFNSHWWTEGLMLARGYRYDPAALESALQARFKGRCMVNCPVPVIITSVDRNSKSAVFFKSTDPDCADVLMWQAARATSAAQTYFPPFAFRGWSLVDGGTAANNPAMCALAQATSLWGWHEDYKLLALGCGNPAYSKEPENPGAVTILKESIGMLLASSDELPDYQCRQMLQPNSYYSIEPNQLDVGLDDASVAGLTQLNNTALKVIRDNSGTIDLFCS